MPQLRQSPFCRLHFLLSFELRYHARGTGGPRLSGRCRYGTATSSTHYDTLGVSPQASDAEIKRSFYRLCKIHHPDHNPDDLTASARFVRLRDAFAVLSEPTRRAAYDGTVLRAPPPPPSRGSYHSSRPAGGRAGAGLQSRRPPFRGSPFCFDRDGVAGAGPDAGASTTYAGMGPGQDPFRFRRPGHAPHFDREAHQRTQRREDEKRDRRARQREKERLTYELGFEPQASQRAHRFILAALVTISTVVPILIFTWQNSRA